MIKLFYCEDFIFYIHLSVLFIFVIKRQLSDSYLVIKWRNSWADPELPKIGYSLRGHDIPVGRELWPGLGWKWLMWCKTMNRGCIMAGGNSSMAAAAAAMTWCSSRASGHSLRVNMSDLYSGLFRLRDTLSREVFSRDNLSRDAVCRLSLLGKPPLLLLQAIRCTHPTCPCECFAPGKQSLRYCDTCNHGWVAHGEYYVSLYIAWDYTRVNICNLEQVRLFQLSFCMLVT